MTARVTIFTVLIVIYIVTACKALCPDLNIATGCSCKTLHDQDQEAFSILTCHFLNSEDDLQNVLVMTRGYPMFELELVNSSLRYIPSEAFLGTTFEVLSIKDSSIHALSDKDVAFVGLEKQLHLIEIINCSYTSNWEWSQLANLVHLMEVHVSNSELTDITEGLSRIQHIDVEAFGFQKNLIQVLHERAFAPFSNLKRLSLDNNHISHLSRSMFPKPAKFLKVVGLSYNNLMDLPEGLFEDMPALRSLYLTGNPLHTIKESVFKPVWKQLSLFLFYATNLSCDCRLTWLAEANNSRKYMHGECVAPAGFKGRYINSLQPFELRC